jgi:hypothetical protein
MSARIIVTLVMEYAGNDVDEYVRAQDDAQECVSFAGEEMAARYEPVRVVDVQVSG